MKETHTYKYYAIVNTENPDWYWNEEWGWINIPSGEEGEISFYEEKDDSKLPPDGEWKLL